MIAALGDFARYHTSTFRTLWRTGNNCVTAPLFPLLTILLMLFLPVLQAPAAETNCEEMAFFDDGVMIRVPVTAFGKTLYFMVDTGFTRSAIDVAYASRLGEPLGTRDAESPLQAQDQVLVYKAPEIFVGTKRLELKKIFCLDLGMVRAISGQPCDGVIGMDILTNAVASFDFDQKTFSFGNTPPETDGKWIEVPVRKSGLNFFVSAQINHSEPMDLLVDTGDSSSVSLNASVWKQILSSDPSHQASVTVASVDNQVRTSKIGVLDAVTLQNLDYTNLHATLIPNPEDFSHVGLGFFRRHRVIFDFPNHRLYLEPGKRFSRSDTEDQSGLHLLRQGEATLVFSVDEESPAFSHGIRPKDEVVTINGQECSSLTMKAIRAELQAGDGKTVKLQVKRGSELLNVSFGLKKVI